MIMAGQWQKSQAWSLPPNIMKYYAWRAFFALTRLKDAARISVFP